MLTYLGPHLMRAGWKVVELLWGVGGTLADYLARWEDAFE